MAEPSLTRWLGVRSSSSTSTSSKAKSPKRCFKLSSMSALASLRTSTLEVRFPLRLGASSRSPSHPPDAFYESLTPYSAFTARVFFNHLRTLEDPRLVDIEPVVTALAFYIQAQWTQLVVLLESEEHDEDVELTQEFIVGELVTMAVNADYGDEIGRRKMFELMRESLSLPHRRAELLTLVLVTGEMLSNFSLPPSLVPKCLDVLLKVNTSEKEFMRIVVEIVQALRADSELMTSEDENADDDEEVDEDEDEEAFLARRAAAKAARYAAMAPADIQRRKDLDLRCLVVVKALLERVMGVSDEPELRVGVGDVVDGGPPVSVR